MELCNEPTTRASLSNVLPDRQAGGRRLDFAAYIWCELPARYRRRPRAIYIAVMIYLRTAAILLLLIFGPGFAVAQQAHGSEDRVSARLREMYPSNADAKKEIATAVQAASREHKRVLLVFGASWCFDCFALDYRFHQPNIQALLGKNYRVVHVDIGEHDKNLDVANRYQTPTEAVPALAVLDSNGKLLYSGKLHQFSAARNLDPQVIMKFLETWKPTA